MRVSGPEGRFYQPCGGSASAPLLPQAADHFTNARTRSFLSKTRGTGPPSSHTPNCLKERRISPRAGKPFLRVLAMRNRV